MTGTFDGWSKSEKLIKTGDVFEKNVTLSSADNKIYYKVRRGNKEFPRFMKGTSTCCAIYSDNLVCLALPAGLGVSMSTGDLQTIFILDY